MNKHEFKAFETMQDFLVKAFEEIEKLELRLEAIRAVARKGSISNQERVAIVEICEGK